MSTRGAALEGRGDANQSRPVPARNPRPRGKGEQVKWELQYSISNGNSLCPKGRLFRTKVRSNTKFALVGTFF